MPRWEKRAFGTTRTRAGESRDSEPRSWSSDQARPSNEGDDARLPHEAISLHASSATAWRVRSAAVSSHVSPVLTRASGTSRPRVTVSQARRTNGGGWQPPVTPASRHARAAALTSLFQSGVGGHRLPGGGATTKR